MSNNRFGLFGQSVAGADCPGRDKCIRGYNLCGACERVVGKGYYGHLWLYDGGNFAITRFDITFTEDCTIQTHLPGCVLLTCFSHTQQTGADARTILCYCEDEHTPHRNQIAFKKGNCITGTEITLTNHFCAEKYAGFERCRACLCATFANTQTLQEHAALMQIFDQLNACEFPPSVARMYFEGKALEALAVLSAGCGTAAFEDGFSADRDTDNDFISRAKQYIDENSNTELTIELLAKIACMSPSKLKYSFKRLFNKSTFEYITEIRMEKAKRLLADTGLSIESIAMQVGSKKSGAFAAAFRKYTGALPKEYRSAKRAKLMGV